jgi:hypothetical protein
MCDYSLEYLKSRPARLGEKLRTQRFNLVTSGFASAEDCNTAVCVLPGTELAFATAVSLGWFGWKLGTIKHTTAIFRQVNKHSRMHHDALEFPDGQVALLTDLVEGQEATVLQLPAQPLIAAEIKAQERVPHVG